MQQHVIQRPRAQLSQRRGKPDPGEKAHEKDEAREALKEEASKEEASKEEAELYAALDDLESVRIKILCPLGL